MPTLVLFDGHALIYRAYHALPPLTTASGELTNAVFGFTSMLLKALNDLKPEYVAVAFDRAAPTFRHLEYDGYKAQRPAMPDDLSSQIGRVRQIVQAFNIPIFEVDGFEADDVLGTLSRQAEAREVDTVIVTGDLDALQLVDERVRVYAARRSIADTVIYDEAAVRERYGVAPAQMVDFKALKGDPSDNIPGVPGIGEKTASRLIATYGTLEGLYEHLDQLPARVQGQLGPNREQAFQGKRLSTIIRDVPGVTFDPEACRWGGYEREKVVRLFRELEFASLIGRLPDAAPQRQMALMGDNGSGEATIVVGKSAPPGHARVLAGEAALAELARQVRATGACLVRTVARGNGTVGDMLVGLALAGRYARHAAYVPLPPDEQAQARLLAPLKGLLEDPSLPKYGHDLKQDYLLLHAAGINLAGLDTDVMLTAYLLNPGQRPALRETAFKALGLEYQSVRDLVAAAGRGASPATLAADVLATCMGAELTAVWELAEAQCRELEEKQLLALLRNVEMPLIPVLARMELNGVALDLGILREMSQELHTRASELEQAIYQDVGHQFNVNSGQQLAAVLFGELKLPSARRTKTGYSTDASVLEGLRGTHPVIDHVLEYRQLTKLLSTYIDALPGLINPRTGRVHTSFNQALAATGRVSSEGPNLQNIPIRTELGYRIRRAFVPGTPGWLMLAADYSQIELRILAHITGDPRLVEAFTNGEDIHTLTAALVFGVPQEAVTPEHRRVAKMVNFGIAYGMSDFGLAQRTDISRQEATAFIRNYMETYPGIKQFMDRTRVEAAERGYVSTLLHRRRYLPEIHARSYPVRSAAEREAINMPIQGSAADIMKLAMIDVHREMERRGMQSRMVLQVHDELVFEVPPEELDDLRGMVRSKMEQAMELRVPLEVEVHVGPNWGQMA